MSEFDYGNEYYGAGYGGIDPNDSASEPLIDRAVQNALVQNSYIQQQTMQAQQFAMQAEADQDALFAAAAADAEPRGISVEQLTSAVERAAFAGVQAQNRAGELRLRRSRRGAEGAAQLSELA